MFEKTKNQDIKPNLDKLQKKIKIEDDFKTIIQGMDSLNTFSAHPKVYINEKNILRQSYLERMQRIQKNKKDIDMLHEQQMVYFNYRDINRQLYNLWNSNL